MEPKPEPPVQETPVADTVQAAPPVENEIEAESSAEAPADSEPKTEPADTGNKKTDLSTVDFKQADKASAVPKKRGSGVTAAIIATVVIVLGLAVLAVYAYLQTPGIR